jgi:hypothetical protein
LKKEKYRESQKKKKIRGSSDKNHKASGKVKIKTLKIKINFN